METVEIKVELLKQVIEQLKLAQQDYFVHTTEEIIWELEDILRNN